MTLKQLGWPTIATLALALACALIAVLAPDSMVAAMFWPVPLAAFLALLVALWTTRRWALLLLLPFIIWPLWLILVLSISCFGFGDCP